MFWRKQEAVSVFILGNQANSWILNISNSGNLSLLFSISLSYSDIQCFLLVSLWYSGFHWVTSDLYSRGGFFFHIVGWIYPDPVLVRSTRIMKVKCPWCNVFESIFDMPFGISLKKAQVLGRCIVMNTLLFVVIC